MTRSIEARLAESGQNGTVEAKPSAAVDYPEAAVQVLFTSVFSSQFGLGFCVSRAAGKCQATTLFKTDMEFGCPTSLQKNP